MKKNTKKLEKILKILIFFIIIVLGSCFNLEVEDETGNTVDKNSISYKISNIPEYNGQAYVEINNNIPRFTVEEINLNGDYYSILKDGRVRKGYYKNLLGKSKRR